MLKMFLLSMRWFIRDLKVKEWNSVLLTLILCISCIHSFELISDRLIRGIQHQSVEFLGGNLLISSPEPIPQPWIDRAHSLHLHTAEVWSYLSMLSLGERLQLVNVYAVSNPFPLYGNKISWRPFDLYAEPKLLDVENKKQPTSARLGTKFFNVHRANSTAFHFTNGIPLAPFAVIRIDDARQTNTIVPGSRIEYLVFLKGTDKDIQQFQTWLRPQLNLAQKLIDPSNNQSIMLNLITRFGDYLRFTLLIIIALSSISIALSFSYKQQFLIEKFALWLALGANKQNIRQLTILQFIYVFVFGNIIALLIALLIQQYALFAFKKYLNFTAASFEFLPLLIGVFTSMILLIGLIIPTIQLINKRSPSDLWRNTPHQLNRILRFTPFILLVNLIGFQLLNVNYSMLNVMITGGLIFVIGFIAILIHLFLKYSSWIADRCTGHWRFALKQFSSFPELTTLHLSSFIFALFPLMLLFMVKNNIIHDWLHQLPKSTPNFYLFNLSKDDLPQLKFLMKNNRIHTEAIYPIVKGRLFSLNNKPILQAVPESGRNHNALKRDLNLSSMLTFPSDNVITNGKKWTHTDISTPFISVEKNLADKLQLHLGDRLSFKINNEEIQATINNIRSVSWTSFHPNFFIIFTPGQLDRFPTTYITSFYLNSSQQQLTKTFSQPFPNATLIDISYVIQQVQNLMNQLVFILDYLFLFSILIAIVISWSCHLIVQQQRQQSLQIAHVLGASLTFIRKSKFIEWCLIVGLVVFFSIGFSLLLYQAILLVII